MRVTYDEENGYDIDQEMSIENILKEHGLEHAHGRRAPIGKECNKPPEGNEEMLPVAEPVGTVTVRKLQILEESLLWVAQYHTLFSRRTHEPIMSD